MDNVRERLVKTTPCGRGIISRREAGYMCRRARSVPRERRARKKSCSDEIFLGDSDLRFVCSQGGRVTSYITLYLPFPRGIREE